MTNLNIREQVDLIREVFAYTERFSGSTFVIKISNTIIDHPDFPQHARDLALLHKSGIRIVIVPGSRERIDELLDRFGVKNHSNNGMRISTPQSIDLIKTAAFDVAHRVMTALSGHRITAVIGNWIRARSRGVIAGVDYERTGLVDRINTEAVMRFLEQGNVPIFPCIGHNDVGDPFNLALDDVVGTVATALNAEKIFHIGSEPGMHTSKWSVPEEVEVLEDGRIFRMTPSGVKKMVTLNPQNPGSSLLESAAAACQAGISRVHILDGRQPGVLLKEIFSNLGVGTMVYAEAYERLRPMKASDVPGVLELMAPLVTEGVLVERTREELERKQKDYWVYSMDGVVHGCAALHRITPECAEMAGVAVDPRFVQLGIGAKLVAKLSEKAVEAGIRQIFVLTTRTADWFLAQGFRNISLNELPAKRRADFDIKRNSRILVRDLDA